MLSRINQLIALFAGAVEQLGISVPMADVEHQAMRVHAAMDSGQRVFHTSGHVLNLCRDLSPHQVLAGLYHDIVYFQLDDGFPRPFEALLRKVVEPGPFGMHLCHGIADDPELALSVRIFGVRPGDALPLYGGLNEFLSSVVAVNCLSTYLQRDDLFRVVALISATMPAWSRPAAETLAPAEAMAARLRAADQALGIGISAAAMDELMHQAVALANRDVSGFAVEDPGAFLVATWALIEESNAPLTGGRGYTIRDFRMALQRMDSFLTTLNPDCIFHSYKHCPDACEMERLAALAETNLSFTVAFLDAKLAAIAVLEALALASGGDAPVSMFLGDLQPEGDHANPMPVGCQSRLHLRSRLIPRCWRCWNKACIRPIAADSGLRRSRCFSIAAWASVALMNCCKMPNACSSAI